MSTLSAEQQQTISDILAYSRNYYGNGDPFADRKSLAQAGFAPVKVGQPQAGDVILLPDDEPDDLLLLVTAPGRATAVQFADTDEPAISPDLDLNIDPTDENIQSPLVGVDPADLIVLRRAPATGKPAKSKSMKRESAPQQIVSAVLEHARAGKLGEMAAIGDFSSGAWGDRETALANVGAFRHGYETADLRNGDKYIGVKNLTSTALTKGQIVLAAYNEHNQGADVYEILGFNAGAAGDDEVVFNSVKELLAHSGYKTLAELDAAGGDARMVVKDLDSGESGGWFYIYKGRWARGSGAERLSFILAKKVEDEPAAAAAPAA